MVDKHKFVTAWREIAEEVAGEREDNCSVVLACWEVGVAVTGKIIVLGGADVVEVRCAVIVALGQCDGEGTGAV